MTVIDKGHHYALNALDGGENAITGIKFVKREGPQYPGNRGSYMGTNIQEVLRALIDRVQYLDGQVPCRENGLLVDKFRESILLLEERAAARHGLSPDAGMYGANGISPSVTIEKLPTCWMCGHISCACTRAAIDAARGGA